MDQQEPLNLHDVLYNSYENDPNRLTSTGFNYDKELSDHNQQVYYNPSKQKLLYSIAGTQSGNDVGTDLLMGLGLLKNTKRYKEADDKLAKAKDKYKPNNTIIAGSSLGGSIASKIGKAEDKIYTYNKFSHIAEKVMPNEQSYRSSGDLVSIFNPSKNTKTFNTKILPIYLPTYSGVARNGIEQHKLKHLKGKNIYV